MHIAEGFLPASQSVGWFVASAPFVVHGARRVIELVRTDPDTRLLLGAAGAFTFVLSAIKLPSVTGSSSHPTGTGVGAVLFRPPVMAFLSLIVLIFQALLLAHGGLSTLGANVFSMGVVGPWVGYGCYRLARRARAGFGVGVFAAAAMADLSTYVMTSVQLGLAYPDPTSGVAGGIAKFLAVYALTQVPLAVAEGFVAVGMMRMLSRVAAPELARLNVMAGAR